MYNTNTTFTKSISMVDDRITIDLDVLKYTNTDFVYKGESYSVCDFLEMIRKSKD